MQCSPDTTLDAALVPAVVHWHSTSDLGDARDAALRGVYQKAADDRKRRWSRPNYGWPWMRRQVL